MRRAQLRVFLVEDECLIAMLIEDLLIELGHELAGSVQDLEEALAMARNGRFDLGLLDVRVKGGMTYAVADILLMRGIPFAFVTGNDPGVPKYTNAAVPVLQKPFRLESLAAMIDRLVSGESGSGESGALPE